MKSHLILLSVLTLFSYTSMAQKNTLLELGNKKVSLEEFERIYKKNNTQLSDESEIKSPADYLQMFIDFKLKVIEAEARGLDTAKTFINELSGYRTELAKPYLTDVSFTDSMVRTAYYRSISEVNASHILIMVDENASPEDTLKAFNKIIEIRNLFLAGGKSFEELAKANSEDPSAQTNGGNLGYFRAFQMITPFENVAFTTKPGEISQPVRTRFGYHLVYTIDIRPIKPDIKVAHIMKMFANPEAVTDEEVNRLKASIDSVYQLFLNGEDFGQLAQKYSDDRRSASNNGEMSWISSSFGVPQFTEAAYALQNDGDVSGVIRTNYGWHIIKRIELRPIPTYESLEEQLTNQIKSDPQRSASSKTNFVNQLKKEYGYSKSSSGLQPLLSMIEAMKTDSIGHSLPAEVAGSELYTFAGKKQTIADYVTYLFKTRMNPEKIAVKGIENELNSFEEDAITQYEDARLEAKYPDFAALMQEYHDGILLFTIMEEKVWNKAMADSSGLEVFYQKNPGLFKFGEHFDGMIVECTTPEAKEKAKTLISNGLIDPKAIEEQINTSEQKLITITKGRWEKGDNDVVNYFIWNSEKPATLDESLVFVHGDKKMSADKTLEEARGLYVSEYQDALEKEWIKELREKYPVKINNRLLKKVKPVNQ